LKQSSTSTISTFVVIPCYKVREHILGVIGGIGPEVDRILVVDDACPQSTGDFVRQRATDPRVQVLFNPKNLGVGGATIAGFKQALRDGADVIVKLDGDGQMDPRLIPFLIQPIRDGEADYTKGNRFFTPDSLNSMPLARLFGNAALSFVSKASSGYWDVMDPTNGFTAIQATALSLLPLDKIDNGYFFESDMLFRLNTIRAVIREMPMEAKYGSEKSNLKIYKVLGEFPVKHSVRFLKRIFYNYFLRDFNVCSIELVAGLVLSIFGLTYGSIHWYRSFTLNIATPTGTVMMAVLPIIIGFQLLLAAITLDVTNIPRSPLQRSLRNRVRNQDAVQPTKSVANL